MTEDNNILPELFPLNDKAEGNREKVTPLFTGSLFGPQMLLMRTEEDGEEKDPNP